jgi:hypothetical protein
MDVNKYAICPPKQHSPSVNSLSTQRTITPVESFFPAIIGAFLGFVFGVGCALAVMYSIYMGGYRAAVKDSQMEPPPERLSKALAKLSH